MKRPLNDSGVEGAQAHELPTTGVSVSMFAQDRYFLELLVVVVAVVVELAELQSPYWLGVTGSSLAWSESSSVYLAPPFLVGSRLMKPLSQLSPSQPLHARPSAVVESCQLNGK